MSLPPRTADRIRDAWGRGLIFAHAHYVVYTSARGVLCFDNHVGTNLQLNLIRAGEKAVGLEPTIGQLGKTLV